MLTKNQKLCHDPQEVLGRLGLKRPISIKFLTLQKGKKKICKGWASITLNTNTKCKGAGHPPTNGTPCPSISLNLKLAPNSIQKSAANDNTSSILPEES